MWEGGGGGNLNLKQITTFCSWMEMAFCGRHLNTVGFYEGGEMFIDRGILRMGSHALFQ